MLTIISISAIAMIVAIELGFIKVKPFNCEQCLAFWITLIYYSLQGQYIEGAMYGALNFYLTRFLSKIIYK